MANQHAVASLPEVMGEMLATFTAGDASVADVLQRIVSSCSYLIDRVDAASITLIDVNGRPFTTAYSEGWIVEVDQLQYTTGEGPCLEVAATSAPAAGSADLADSVNWPVFGPAAAKAGVGALLAVGLSATPDPSDPGSPPGALNLYSRTEYAFDDHRKGQAVVLAAFAGAAVRAAQAREETNPVLSALLTDNHGATYAFSGEEMPPDTPISALHTSCLFHVSPISAILPPFLSLCP